MIRLSTDKHEVVETSGGEVTSADHIQKEDEGKTEVSSMNCL